MSAKIHAAVDGLGNLGLFRLTGGERHDIIEAENLLAGMDDVGAVIADKAFDAANLLARIHELGAQAVIPPRANRRALREFDTHQYKSRNLIEDSSLASNNFAASLRATTNLPSASRRSSLLPLHLSGSPNVHAPWIVLSAIPQENSACRC